MNTQSKIYDLDNSQILRDDNIIKFNITMGNIHAMQKQQPLTNILQNMPYLLHLQSGLIN